MPAEVTLDVSTLYGFLLVLARISGCFVYLPLPAIKAGPEPVRILLSLSLTISLASRWPAIDVAHVGIVQMVGWMLAEAGLGIVAGLAVACLTEVFTMGAQILSLPAGYSFASMVDPTTQADSGVLVITAQLCAGLLFLATGLDHQVLLAFARSFDAHPPGSWMLARSMAEQVVQLSACIFSVGFRLVLPILALLVMVDLSLALLGRLNGQLQLITVAFPLKMLATLSLLALLLAVFPRIFSQLGIQVMETVTRLLNG